MTPAQRWTWDYLLRTGAVRPPLPGEVPADGKPSAVASAPVVEPPDLRGFQDVLRNMLAAFDPSLAYNEANVLLMTHSPRCGCPDFTVQNAARYGWPHKDIRFYCNVSMSGFSLSNVRSLYTRAVEAWAAACDISPEIVLTASSSNVASSSGRIDGQGSTLAYAYLPVNASSTTQLTQLYDSSEPWSQYGSDYAYNVILHELGHSLGLEHGSRGSVMQPYASASLTSLQPEDIRRIQAIYGPKVATPTPTPIPTPTPTPTPADTIDIVVGGRRYRVAAQLVE